MRRAARAFGLLAAALGAQTAGAATGLAPIRHVFVLVLENEPASRTFGPSSPAPYLAKTLPSRGAYMPK